MADEYRDACFTIDFRSPALKKKYIDKVFPISGTEATAQFLNPGDKSLYQTFVTKSYAVNFPNKPIEEAFLRTEGIEKVEIIKHRMHQWGPMKGSDSMERTVTVKLKKGFDIESRPTHVIFVDMSGGIGILSPFTL